MLRQPEPSACANGGDRASTNHAGLRLRAENAKHELRHLFTTNVKSKVWLSGVVPDVLPHACKSVFTRVYEYLMEPWSNQEHHRTGC